MAGVSSDININVKANVKGATSQINAAGDAVRSFGKKTQAANQNVKVFGKNLTGAGGGNKFFRSGLQQAGYQMGDFAVQVGGGTNALQAFGQQAPQFLQIFGPWGSIIGAAVSIFAAVGVAIMKTTDSMEESKPKVKGLGDAISELNAAAQRVSSTFDVSVASSLKAAEEQYGKVTDGVRALLAAQHEVEKQARKDSGMKALSAYMDSFPQDMQALFKELDESLAPLRGKGELDDAYQQSLYEISLRTVALGKSVGQTNLEVHNLFKEFVAAAKGGKDFDSILVRLVEAAKRLPKEQREAILGVEGLIASFVKGEAATAALNKELDQSGGKARKLAADMAALRSSVESFSETDSGLTPVAEALAIQKKINELLKQGVKEAEATEQATRLISGDREADAVHLKNALAAAKDMTNELTKQATVRKGEDMRGFSTGAIPIPQASPVTQAYLKELGKIDLQIAQITEKQRLMNELGLSENVAQQAAKIATTLQLTDAQFALVVEKLKELADASKDSGKELKDAFDKISSSFTSAFKSVIDGTKSVSEAFRDMMGEILSSLMDKSVDAALDGLFDKLSGAGGGGGGGGGDGLWGLLEKGFSYLGGLLSGPSTSGNDVGGLIEPLAKGGYASATRPFLVGEEGPELMIPNASGRVVPNDELGGSGGQINQTFNVSTGVQQTVRAEIQSLMPQIAAASTQAVLDARRRGGSFAGAFA